jgi:hypothetical protein
LGRTPQAGVNVIGYTRPDGNNVLATKGNLTSLTTKLTLQRYSLAGQLQKNLATLTDLSGNAYQSSGRELAAGSLGGVELISNAGGVIRKLRVPGAKYGCTVDRWWTSAAILASCTATFEPTPRLWLVPASGATPTVLTPARKKPGFDMGDFDAWQLSSGLYVDGYGACGTQVIGRQSARGAEQQVNVPGAASSLIVTATRSKLMVERINACSPGVSLVLVQPGERVDDRGRPGPAEPVRRYQRRAVLHRRQI